VNDLLQELRAALPAGTPAIALSRVGDELLARWSEPHRHYHTLAHLVAVLAAIDQYSDYSVQPSLVRLAAWYHDAVYNPRRLDNEEQSAILAEQQLASLGLPPLQVSEVARLVRLTATHDPRPGDRDGGLLTDADLAILAADAATYRAYVAAVRHEYAHLTDAEFAAGRAIVLHHLLALPNLFHTPALRDRLEQPARHNITSELAALSSAPR
jgi:predicted metal-dependent HD superfamily phosphohydrolase